MIAAESTTYERVLRLLADGEWHTEDELEKVAYFPREWIRELEASGRRVTAENGRVKLER
jgi:hypothetical protein